jgi:hypothetical protein
MPKKKPQLSNSCREEWKEQEWQEEACGLPLGNENGERGALLQSEEWSEEIREQRRDINEEGEGDAHLKSVTVPQAAIIYVLTRFQMPENMLVEDSVGFGCSSGFEYTHL